MANIPYYKNKYKGTPILTAKALIEYKKSVGKSLNFDVPKTFFIGYQDSLYKYFKKNYNYKKVNQLKNEFYIATVNKSKIGFISGFGIGAPATSVILEELIALGVQRFIVVGTAGSLQTNLKAGDVVICNKAFSDDGVSRHYLKNVDYTRPNLDLTNIVSKTLKTNNIIVSKGSSWTIDAPFMETDLELVYFKKKGVATVDMEAAAIFAISKVKKVSAACVFIISDTLSNKWVPSFNSTIVQEKLNLTFDTLMYDLNYV